MERERKRQRKSEKWENATFFDKEIVNNSCFFDLHTALFDHFTRINLFNQIPGNKSSHKHIPVKGAMSMFMGNTYNPDIFLNKYKLVVHTEVL